MWLIKLKIAIVEKNTDSINALTEDIPKLSKQEDVQQAIYLLKQATELVTTLKDKTSTTMTQIKANLKFLSATQAPPRNKLDITL